MEAESWLCWVQADRNMFAQSLFPEPAICPARASQRDKNGLSEYVSIVRPTMCDHMAMVTGFIGLVKSTIATLALITCLGQAEAAKVVEEAKRQRIVSTSEDPVSSYSSCRTY